MNATPAFTMGAIVAAMCLVALVEATIPLVAASKWSRAHLAPNLALTFVTFATNACFNAALVGTLARLESARFGPLRWLGLASWVELLLVLAILDFSFYVAHVAMHKVRAFWRFHAVHHSDPMVDVTTTIRQHPLEGVLRYAFMACFAIGIGASPPSFAVYRLASALNGLLEHANVRVPFWFDRVLSLVTTWPHVHKLHHSRSTRETDTNYGNLFSLWDRVFGTFVQPHEGSVVSYGLDGLDRRDQQTTAALLVAPFRSRPEIRRSTI